jgi:hypothetical protein
VLRRKSYYESFARFLEEPKRDSFRGLMKANPGELRSCDFKLEGRSQPLFQGKSSAWPARAAAAWSWVLLRLQIGLNVLAAFSRPNPKYPDEDFEGFVLRMIEQERLRIAEALDVARQSAKEALSTDESSSQSAHNSQVRLNSTL